MSWMSRLLRRRHIERELDRELSFHVEEEARRLVAAGVEPGEARRQALAAFGGLEPIKEQARDARGTRWVEDLVQDVRLALRMMRRSPGFALTAVLSLAIGVGANAAIFSVTDALLRRPLPVTRPDELHFLNYAGEAEPNLRFSWPTIEGLRAQVPEAQFAAMTGHTRLQATVGDHERLVAGQLVSGNWFPLLGVRAAAGRVLGPDDTRAIGGEPVVVLSHAFWDREFGRSPAVIGTPLVVNRQQLTVVGVAAESFTGVYVGESADLWIPMTLQDALRYRSDASSRNADENKPWMPQDGIQWLTVLARIPERSLAMTRPRIATVGKTLLERSATGIKDPGQRAAFLRHPVELLPGAKGLSNYRSKFATSLKVLGVTVAIVLLIACGNLASLLLARSSARHHEFALRLSIGARRGRLIRQLLTETMVLAVLGGALGVAVALSGGRLLLQIASPSSRPIPLALPLDWRLVGFALVVSVVTGLLFGLGPAIRLSRAGVTDVLRPGGRVLGAQGKGVLRIGRSLVVGQVALSLALLVGAALFVRTLGNLLASDLGFDRSSIIAARFDPTLAGVPRAEWPDLRRRLVEAAAAIPGASHAVLALNGPLSGGARISDIQIGGQPERPGNEADVREDYVGSGYFAMVRTPLLQGRDFAPQDDDKHPKVAIVSQAMATHFFGQANPIGQHFGYGSPANVEIVGIVADTHIDGILDPPPRLVYYPLSQFPGESVRHLYVRIEGSEAASAAMAGAVRGAITAADKRIAVSDVATLQQLSARTVTNTRLVSQLTGVFGLLAVAVACLGLYGTLSYAVARRTNEIGVRLALGAAPATVWWTVIRDALSLIGLGCAIGLVVAWLGMRSVSSLLYGLSPSDPATFALATLLLFVVATAAAAAPAWRAARVDPLRALRAD